MKKTWFILVASLALIFGVGYAQVAEAAPAEIQVEIDGQAVAFDQPPIIENDRVMVPMRALAEELGAEVGWDNERRMMTATLDYNTLYLNIDMYVMYKNFEPIVLDAAPMIVNGRTLAPLRALSEGFGAEVSWDGQTRKVTVISPDAAEANYAYEVFELTNAEREKAGLSPFEWSDALADVATAHSKDMYDRGFFSHVNLDGLSPFDRMHNAGIHFSAAAENIASGYRTPAEVVAGWMDSPGHRANILNPDLHKLGVGYYKDNWTQCFTN